MKNEWILYFIWVFLYLFVFWIFLWEKRFWLKYWSFEVLKLRFLRFCGIKFFVCFFNCVLLVVDFVCVCLLIFCVLLWLLIVVCVLFVVVLFDFGVVGEVWSWCMNLYVFCFMYNWRMLYCFGVFWWCGFIVLNLFIEEEMEE